MILIHLYLSLTGGALAGPCNELFRVQRQETFASDILRAKNGFYHQGKWLSKMGESLDLSAALETLAIELGSGQSSEIDSLGKFIDGRAPIPRPESDSLLWASQHSHLVRLHYILEQLKLGNQVELSKPRRGRSANLKVNGMAVEMISLSFQRSQSIQIERSSDRSRISVGFDAGSHRERSGVVSRAVRVAFPRRFAVLRDRLSEKFINERKRDPETTTIVDVVIDLRDLRSDQYADTLSAMIGDMVAAWPCESLDGMVLHLVFSNRTIALGFSQNRHTRVRVEAAFQVLTEGTREGVGASEFSVER